MKRLARAQRWSLSKRLDEFMRCGRYVLVRECGGCGDGRDGSGTFQGTRTCKARACATCAWVRAKGIGDGLERAFDEVPQHDGYQWQLAVVTIKYDPADPGEMIPEGLRARARLALKLAKAAWKRLKVKGAGMLRSTEVSARGFVHLNLVYYGPPIDAEQLGAEMQAVDCRAGYVRVRPLDTDPAARKEDRVKSEDPRGSKAAVRTAGRYVAKGHERTRGSFSESWLAGDRSAKTIDPILAARWEIATYRMQLLGRYGALRGLGIEEMPRAREDANDEHTSCEACGTVGEWKWSRRETEEWLQGCHDRGRQGLVRSSWSRDGPHP